MRVASRVAKQLKTFMIFGNLGNIGKKLKYRWKQSLVPSLRNKTLVLVDKNNKKIDTKKFPYEHRPSYLE